MKTNLGLVEYCKAQLGLPYWYGTFGQVSTESLYGQKKKQYPSKYTATDFDTQYGKKVHDCVGLIKGYLLSDDNGNLTSFSKETFRKYDKNVSGMLKNCSINGFLNTMPEIPGLLLFNKNYTHVGIYIGNGEAIEARGHKYGVVKTNLKDRNWYKWGSLDWIEYDETEENVMLNELINLYGKDAVKKSLVKLIESVNDDGKESKWATEEFEEAKKLEITDGTNPEMFATRQEVAIMVKRAISK